MDGDLLYDISVVTIFGSSVVTYTTNSQVPLMATSYEIVNGNGSCIRLGCTTTWADNYDELATEDDGSCVRSGCTSTWADNYDYLATDDDGSCLGLGCTDSNDCIYDALATEDNGSLCRSSRMYRRVLCRI